MSTITSNKSLLAEANRALVRGENHTAVRLYVELLKSHPELNALINFNLTIARNRWRKSRQKEVQIVGICGWEMSHNAAGRVHALADVAAGITETEIIGATFARWGDSVWGPVRGRDAKTHLIHIQNETYFPTQAMDMVCSHPYDTVILSKPRWPNIFIGLLYKLIWDARVIVDIDDEELGAVRAEKTLSIDAMSKQQGVNPCWKDLGGKDWTRVAVGLWDIFDASSVSNKALQQRYAGPIIPHARDAQKFKNSTAKMKASREKFGIPKEKTVVLFFGTPRRHKGILETAKAISELKRQELCLVVIGDFPDLTLKEDLKKIEGLDLRLFPNQPYADIADIVAIGDLCVLLQDDSELLGRYQIPAKLVDALAMEVLILIQPTNAVSCIVDAGVVVTTNPSTIKETISHVLDNPGHYAETRRQGRLYFENHLSLNIAQSKLSDLLATDNNPAPQGRLFANNQQLALFEAIGGWALFSPEKVNSQPCPQHTANSATIESSTAVEMGIPELPSALTKTSAKYALIVHAYHLDTLPELSKYAANFPASGDQFVTCPDTFGTEQLAYIARALPRARIIQVPNAGQDVGALMALMDRVDLSHYTLICKIHSKKGAKEPTRWRHALLRGVLSSEKQVNTILNAFEKNPNLLLAGASQLYLHGPTYMWKNAEVLETTFKNTLGSFDYINKDWGFIAGTCFWMRTSALSEIKRVLAPTVFTKAAYVDDGTIAHSVERMFGMIATLKGGSILLNDVEDSEKNEVIPFGFPSDGSRTRLMISEILKNINFPVALLKSWAPKGGLNGINGAMLKGWLAVVGDHTARNGILKIDKHSVSAKADIFRADLRSNGINEGKHAFQVQVPAALLDGKEHEVLLIDADTETEVSRKVYKFEKVQRDYWDFQGFLKSSMTQPEICTPFVEADKRAFAVMEGIANRFCTLALALQNRPLVSVIMPMYNRCTVVKESIDSVLAQTYADFELLVVDDGSTDSSVEAVKSMPDPRIKLIQLGENQGVTIARNTALKAAKGTIIAYLDSDNSWDPRFLAAHVGALNELPQADLIYSGVLLYAGSSGEPYAVRYGHLHRALLENKNYIDNNIVVHRSSFIDQLGGFDEKLRRYVDWDLVLRAVEQGTVYSIPMLLCHYFYGKTENAITDNPTHSDHLQILQKNQRQRKSDLLDSLDKVDLTRPVSVIIPSWQALDDIRDCITALCLRDWKGMLDIIVVDNDSKEDVKAYLSSEHLAKRIHYISLDANYGFTHAVNIGIHKAKPQSDILLLNNDAIALPGSIQALQSACLNRTDAGMTVPRQILPAGTKTLRTHVPFARETDDCDVNISAHHRNISNVPVFHDGGDLEVNYAPFFAVYIRRELLNEIGILDAEYGRHYRSDRVYSDIMRNLTKYRMYYTPNSHFIHKLQKSTDQLRDTGAKDKSYDLMFKRNQWDEETSKRLGYRLAAWDIF